MLHGTTTARLTRREIARWTKITGFAPESVRTIGDLLHYVARCKRYFWGSSDDTKFLHLLISEELQRNLASVQDRHR
jgi:hypothetical protein